MFTTETIVLCNLRRCHKQHTRKGECVVLVNVQNLDVENKRFFRRWMIQVHDDGSFLISETGKWSVSPFRAQGSAP